MTRLVFGGLIAIVLLVFYVYATVLAILAVYCVITPGCTDYSKDLNEGIITILNLVGGLVSALVIATLAVTEPGQAPGQFAEANFTESVAEGGGSKTTHINTKVVKIIAAVYILVWVICGIASLVVGYLKYPNVVPALTASAKSWLGLAVAAAYSYLGLKR